MRIKFILVEPKVPENIGAAARAIKTMGFSELYLVNPCEYKSGKARWLAHGSHDVIDRALTFETLAKAVEKMDIVIGTTARRRITKSEYIDIRDLNDLLTEQAGHNNTISIVFGREESGLSNEELALCDITSSISMAATYPSLNLSHAVMLYAYELGQLALKQHKQREAAGTQSLSLLKAKVDELLSGTNVGKNRALKGRIMERLVMLPGKDINLVHSIANALAEKNKINKQ